MDEKKLGKLLEVLVDKIENLEIGISIKDISYRELKEKHERLQKENDTLRADNVLLTRELRGEGFKKVERSEDANG